METVTASILKMIYAKEDSGFKVIVTRTQAGKSLIITGEFGPEIIPETVATFHGKYGTHPKYGHQFKALSYLVVHNAQELASVKIFLNSIADSVGPERSEAIIAYFGVETLNIIENNPNRLIEVPGIGKIIAGKIEAAWQENRHKWSAEKIIYSLRAFLMSIGLREKRIKKVLDHFGGRESQAENAIRENPYSLAELDDFGFTTVDFIAKQLGITDDNPLRFKAFILYLMEYISPSNGHLFLTTDEINEALIKYSSENNTQFLGGQITDFIIFQYVKELVSEEKLVLDGSRVYSKKQFDFESKSASLLAQIALEKSDLLFLNKEKVDDFIETFEHEHGWILSDEQRKALYYFVEKKVFVITGLPGTGKTTVLKAVVDLALSLKLDLTCMTPTGISAKKLSGVIQNDAYTIHRKLGFRGNKWTYDEVNQYHTDVAIVDESSMVDQEVFYRLLSALKKRTHLIFVGDHNQLPSVGAGNVLRELINCNQIPVVKLDKIFRQDEASDIIKASHRIIQGDTNLELFKKDPAADIFFMRLQHPMEIEQIIIALAAKFKDERREFQIISARNDGPLGINPLNNILQEALNPPAPHLTEVKMPYFTIRVGDRVIVKKNDYENEIFNGDIGKVTFIGSGKVMIKIDERLITLSVDEVNEKIKLAYGITIHKCLPGSALILTPNGYSPLSDIKKGSSVHTKNGNFPVFNHFKTGKKVAYKITTRSNSTYICSEDHPYFITDKSSFPDYKPAKNIKINDYLTIYRNCIISGVSQPINIDNSSLRAFSVNLPKNFDEDLCWLIAVIIGDANTTDKDDGIIELSGPTKIEILDRFKSIVNSYGIGTHDRFKKGKLYGRYIISKNFRNWLLSIGVDYSRAATKSIPSIIFNCKNSCRAAFIGGLIDTDGCMDKHPSMRYTTASERLADDLKLLFLSMGIIAFKAKQNDVHYKIQVTGYDLELLREIIPIHHAKKNKILFSYKISHKTNHYEIPQEKLLIELFLQAFKNHEGDSQGKKGKGLFAKYTALSIKLSDIKNGVNILRRPILIEMQEIALKEGFQLPSEISDYINNNWYFDKIVKIEKLEEQEMYDIEVTNEHSYIHQGAICHNSQGLEYETIILPFINQYGKNMLQRNLLYTAITRAKKKIIVLGHGSAIEKAIENTSVTKRNTVLGERIKECLHQKKKPFLLESLSEPKHSLAVSINREHALSEEEKFYPMDLIEE